MFHSPPLPPTTSSLNIWPFWDLSSLGFQTPALAGLLLPSDKLLLWEISLDLSQSFPFLAPSAPPVSYGAKWYVLSPPPSLDCESTLIHVGPHGGLSAQEALSIFAK